MIETQPPIDNLTLLDVVKTIQASKKFFGEWSALSQEARNNEILNTFNHLKQHAQVICEAEAVASMTPQNELWQSEYQPFFESFNALKIADVSQPYGVISCLLPEPQSVCSWLATILNEAATGNVLIIKPSQKRLSPWKKLNEVLNLASHQGAQAFKFVDSFGEFLVEHPGIDAIHFGGSLDSARKLFGAKSVLGAQVRVESSSLNFAVVLKESNIAGAAKVIAKSVWHRWGQSNRKISKVYVVDQALAEFKTVLLAELKSFTWATPSKEMSQNFDELKKQLGADKGVNLFTGEGPVVLEDFNDCSELQQVEMLFPVLQIRTIKYPADAAKWGSAQPYGRSVSIFCDDVERAKKLAGKFECGQVFVNSLEPLWTATRWECLRKSSGWGHLGDFSSPKVIL